MPRSWNISLLDAERVLRLKFQAGWKDKSIAEEMPHVSRFQIYRICRHWMRKGWVPYKGCPNPGAGLSERDKGILADLLYLDPTLYLDELATELYSIIGVYRAHSQICRALQVMGLTRKVVMRLPHSARTAHPQLPLIEMIIFT
jgi:transposase